MSRSERASDAFFIEASKRWVLLSEGEEQTDYQLTLTVKPSIDSCQFNTSTPRCFAIAASTSAFRPSSQKNAMHPPPPAPQTFGAIAPFARAASIIWSMCGVVMFGDNLFRWGWESFNVSPAAAQSFEMSA